MSYRIQILRRAQKELAQLSSPEYDRVKEAIRNLSDDPRPQGCKRLTAREGWRIRIRRIHQTSSLGRFNFNLH
jgi:mRNA interferase RelE/StbE